MADTTTYTKNLWFGWLRFRPKWLQVFNTPRWFLVFICSYFFTQSIVVNGVYSVSITTIEKRYGYSSLMTGFLTSSYDIAALIFTPLVSYLGATRKKPLICGTGMLIMGIGFFIFTLPHFLSDTYVYGDPVASIDNLCGAKNISSLGDHDAAFCNGAPRTNLGFYLLFIAGMLIIGLGATPMWNLGTSYIDDNVKAKVAPMYIGIYSSSGVIGAGVGFALGGLFLSMYVDLGVQTSLTPKDERWVGAWWLGFLVCTVCCGFWSMWLVAFPREFPQTEELRIAEKEKKSSSVIEATGYSKLKDLPKATMAVMSRVTFIAVTLAACLEASLVAGMTAFMPKIIQQQFRFSASFVSLLMGGVVIPAALSGNIIGSYICKKLQLGLVGAAKMCYIASIISLGTCCFLFLYCDTIPIAGVNTPYINGTVDSVTSLCNTQCACSLVEYSPVCGDGVTYFSACHAGCTMGNINNSQTFSNCSCMVDEGIVTSGSCDSGCGLKPLFYLFIYFLVVFMTFVSATPATIVTLRCIPEDQRAYALGIQGVIVRLLGTIPGPIVMGSVIDTTCILWNNGCGGKGNCLEYDNKSLMVVVIVAAVLVKVTTTIFYVIARLFCPKHHDLEEVKDIQESERNEVILLKVTDKEMEINGNGVSV